MLPAPRSSYKINRKPVDAKSFDKQQHEKQNCKLHSCSLFFLLRWIYFKQNKQRKNYKKNKLPAGIIWLSFCFSNSLHDCSGDVVMCVVLNVSSQLSAYILESQNSSLKGEKKTKCGKSCNIVCVAGLVCVFVGQKCTQTYTICKGFNNMWIQHIHTHHFYFSSNVWFDLAFRPLCTWLKFFANISAATETSLSRPKRYETFFPCTCYQRMATSKQTIFFYRQERRKNSFTQIICKMIMILIFGDKIRARWLYNAYFLAIRRTLICRK